MYKQKEINNNIQESYCSFEVSKLLKEKGFKCWSVNRITDFNGIERLELSDKVSEIFPFNPTHALAIEWIRENKNTATSYKKAYEYAKSTLKP